MKRIRQTVDRHNLRPSVELVTVGLRREAMMVPRTALRSLSEVLPIDVGGGRALVALHALKTAADLELAIIDRLDETTVSETDREVLAMIRETLRTARRDRNATWTIQALLVLDRGRPRPTRRTARRDVPSTTAVSKG